MVHAESDGSLPINNIGNQDTARNVTQDNPYPSIVTAV